LKHDTEKKKIITDSTPWLLQMLAVDNNSQLLLYNIFVFSD